MTIYEWKCKSCSLRFDEFVREGIVECPNCSSTATRRSYNFSVDRTSLKTFPAHWNPNLGKPITSKAQLESSMKEASDAATARTGVEHSFATADLRDRDIFAVKSVGASKQADTEANLVATAERHANPTMTKAVKEILQ